MSDTDTRLHTAKFLTEQARRVAAEARALPDVEDEPVRRAVRVLYDTGKSLMDARAREIGANTRPTGGESKPTNVGDPNGKGRGGPKK